MVAAFGRLINPEGAWTGSGDQSILEFYTPLNVCGLAEDRIVNFCARVGRAGLKYVGALDWTQLWGPTVFHLLSSTTHTEGEVSTPGNF